MDQSSSIDVLFRVYEALRSRGLKCAVPCPGYIEFPNHAFMYAPNSHGNWVHMHQDKSSWTHLISHKDPSVVANAIHAHFSATRKYG
jgi:hypothetical protein